MLFVESRVFTNVCQQLVDDETYARFQQEMVANPEKGDVMKGCGGLRKARIEQPARGKGKRGRCRVIYLYIPEARRIDLIAMYSKDERDDLTSEQRKVLKDLAEQARDEALGKKRQEGKRRR